MEINVKQEIDGEDVARKTICLLVDNSNYSLIEAIEDAIYESEGVYMNIVENSVKQIKPLIINILQHTIERIQNECVD